MRYRSSRGGWVPPPAPRLVVPGRELRAPGDWPAIFERSAPLVVEIGFGKDTFLLEQAAAHPERDHVGVERDPHRVDTFLERAAALRLDNVWAMPIGAEMALGLCFGDAVLSALHVYFPDPWPKVRHARNRLVQPWFAREVRRVLVPEGVLHIATDDVPYRDQILDVMGRSGLENVLDSPWAGEAQPGVWPETPVDAGRVRVGRMSCLSGDSTPSVSPSLTGAADGPPGRSGHSARRPAIPPSPAPRGLPAGPLGHETAFERLWRRHGRDIHHMLYRVRESAPTGRTG